MTSAICDIYGKPCDDINEAQNCIPFNLERDEDFKDDFEISLEADELWDDCYDSEESLDDSECEREDYPLFQNFEIFPKDNELWNDEDQDDDLWNCFDPEEEYSDEYSEYEEDEYSLPKSFSNSSSKLFLKSQWTKREYPLGRKRKRGRDTYKNKRVRGNEKIAWYLLKINRAVIERHEALKKEIEDSLTDLFR